VAYRKLLLVPGAPHAAGLAGARGRIRVHNAYLLTPFARAVLGVAKSQMAARPTAGGVSVAAVIGTVEGPRPATAKKGEKKGKNRYKEGAMSRLGEGAPLRHGEPQAPLCASLSEPRR